MNAEKIFEALTNAGLEPLEGEDGGKVLLRNHCNDWANPLHEITYVCYIEPVCETDFEIEEFRIGITEDTVYTVALDEDGWQVEGKIGTFSTPEELLRFVNELRLPPISVRLSPAAVHAFGIAVEQGVTEDVQRRQHGDELVDAVNKALEAPQYKEWCRLNH